MQGRNGYPEGSVLQTGPVNFVCGFGSPKLALYQHGACACVCMCVCEQWVFFPVRSLCVSVSRGVLCLFIGDHVFLHGCVSPRVSVCI